MNIKLFGILVLIPTISFSLALQEMVVQTIDSNPLVKIEKQKKKASEKDYVRFMQIICQV